MDAINMSQGIRSFKYEEEKELTIPISLADLPVYFDFVRVIALSLTNAIFATVLKMPTAARKNNDIK
nr:hypothetical protein [uncultured Desulfobacter sp.]